MKSETPVHKIPSSVRRRRNFAKMLHNAEKKHAAHHGRNSAKDKIARLWEGAQCA